MVNSIQDDIKIALGLSSVQTEFDTEITIAIKTALAVLNDVGVGSPTVPNPSESTWSDIDDDPYTASLMTSFVYYSVRIQFDPPEMSHLLTAMQTQRSELLERIRIRKENYE